MAVPNKRKNNNIFPSSNIQLEGTFIWQIWLLKTVKKDKSNIKLFYSWVIPNDSSLIGWQDTVVDGSIRG